MNITFRTKELYALAHDQKKRQRKLGKNCAKRLMIRINNLLYAETLEDVRNLPGRFHDLKENRKGQFACDLDHPQRLIFEPHEQPVPTNEHGYFIWQEIKGVEIIEIENYHKEK